MPRDSEISEIYYSTEQLRVIFNKNKNRNTLGLWIKTQRTFPKPSKKIGRYFYYDKKEVYEFKKKFILFGNRAGEVEGYNMQHSSIFDNLVIDNFNK